MIDFNVLKEEYEELTGIKLFDEEGELEDFYREFNQVHKPVCGTWHVNPIPLTAVKRPFCGIASIDITVLSHPDVWDADGGTREKMNAFATAVNGTSREMEDKYKTIYSVSYNCQTCSAGNRILDANIGHGEVIELRQQISYIIIESGVSAYDTFLYIDGLQVPFLSLVENKIHTTSNIPSKTGIMQTMSEQEAYGIDFIIPYMKDDVCNLIRDVIDRATGNEAHCVVLDIAGKKSCHIMQFTHVSSNVQPPQNVGINVSMTELQPDAAWFNDMWMKATTKNYLVKFYPVMLSGTATTVFWGDGTSDTYEDMNISPAHLYTDGEQTHDVLVFVTPTEYYVPIRNGEKYFGRDLYFNLPFPRINSATLRNEQTKETEFFANKDIENPKRECLKLHWLSEDVARVQYDLYGSEFYLDSIGKDGKYYISNRTKFQGLVDDITYVNEEKKQFICTSLWDGTGTPADGGGFFA